MMASAKMLTIFYNGDKGLSAGVFTPAYLSAKNVNAMATKTKKKTEPIQPKIREYSNAGFDLQLIINKIAQGKNLSDATEENADETYHEAIDRLMIETDDFFRAVWSEKEDLQRERDEMQKDLENLKNDVERLDQYTSGIEEVNTMVGELKYQTSNFLDEQIMDAVTELMVEVRPVLLIEILQNTLKGHDLL